MAPRNNEKRNKILTVSYESLCEQPYRGVSLADIAGKAGINKSLLQRYYPQKREIIAALIEDLLNTSFQYMELPDHEEANLFQRISDYNMLFFKAAETSIRLKHFITTSVSEPELLEIWIAVLCDWLRELCYSYSFNYLELKTAIRFSMSGSMSLYEHMDELGLDYRFIMENHMRSVLHLLSFSTEEADAICNITNERIAGISVPDYLSFCTDRLPWFSV